MGWVRDGKPRDDLGDSSPLLVEASADALASLHDDQGLDLNALARFGSTATGEGEAQLVQAVVAPGSEFIGHSVRELNVARRFNAVIVGLWRRGDEHAARLAFVVCTALGTVVAFLTPIGHHGNLLILGPVQYRFGDFMRIGLPLTVMAALVCAWMSRWRWLGGPMWPSLGTRSARVVAPCGFAVLAVAL